MVWLIFAASSPALAKGADNELTDEERRAGWVLLFDGRSWDGWMTSSEKPSQRPVDDGCINPHRCGGYMMIHEKTWENFQLSLDFRISPGCNSGVFVRTWPLTPRPGKDVGFNGIEIAIDELVITCDRNRIEVELNGERVSQMDLDQWTEPHRRPDGSQHKFDVAYKDHPRRGYLGLQDHGQDCWFKNIKLRPLEKKAVGSRE
jgi:hypothetical protein